MRVFGLKQGMNDWCAGIFISVLAAFFACVPALAQTSPDTQAEASILSLPVEAEDDEDALPEDQFSPFRSPGMNLDAEDKDAAFDPFAPPPVAVPKTPEEVKKDIHDRAFDAAITGLLPLNPNDVRTLLNQYDKVQHAVEVPVYPYPKPEVALETVSLDPGAQPPEIKVAAGHVTTLSLLDATGKPWPIQDISWAGNFEMVQPEEGGHVIRITPMSDFAYGNISIRLLKLTTPITFVLRAHRDVVQYRYDARIPDFGPYASAPLIEGGLTLVAGDSVLQNILDGVVPDGAEKMDVAGADSRTTAYRMNQQVYVRTPLTLLSPGWAKSVSSADGMKVYMVSDAPVLLLSDQGQMVRARLASGE